MLILLLVFAACACEEEDGSAVKDRPSPPNIIYILADDLGYGDLGAYGQERIRTPNLDRLAAEGMKFTQHYSGSTVCAPSRASLLTGLHAGHSQIRGNKEIMPIGQHPLQYGTVTIPKLLKEAGYATGGFGKWGLGYPGSEGLPSLQGFDRFFGLLDQRRSHFFYPEFLFDDVRGEDLRQVFLEGNKVQDASRENFERPGAGPAITKGQYSQDAIITEALSFIDENSAGPFFLYYPSQIPHASLEVPDETLELYLDENGESIFNETETYPHGAYTEQPMPRAAYAAMVTRLDMYVGQILDKLEEKEISKNTLVIFTSDNGSYTEGGYHYTMHNSNGNLRGGKRDLYEGGIRVPMIAWWPGKIETGSVNDHISYFPDMLPTLSQLAGVDPPPGLDGISILPSLLGKGEQREHDYLYWEFHAQGGKQAVRQGRWKAVRLNARENSDAQVELYDVEQDPSENNDISAGYPEIAERLKDLMENAHIPSETFPFLVRETTQW